jgi:excisionase family DNA binding protein
MTELARALLDQLGPEDLEQLAERLAPYLRPARAPTEDGWLSTREAAEYAGCSVDALHKAMARRDVRFEQNGRGGKAWFRRSDVDAWRSR